MKEQSKKEEKNHAHQETGVVGKIPGTFEDRTLQDLH